MLKTLSRSIKSGSHSAATVNGEAHLDPIAAVVGQDGEGDGLGIVRGGDRRDLGPAALGIVDRGLTNL